MKRKILIIDDHDNLRSELEKVFRNLGHSVKTAENRQEALHFGNLEEFDLVIIDLDDSHQDCSLNLRGTLPKTFPVKVSGEETVKAFKICASNFRRDEFNEEELKNIFELILNYKAQFIDKTDIVSNLHEKIEFEFPSTIALMHSILDYLIKRVEKLGVVNSENSNLFIALDEAFVNAVKHGNKFDTKKVVKVSADINPEEARFTVEDEGEGFNVNLIPDPLDPQNLFKTSGRGVLIIHNIMDEVNYNERGNRLTMVKHSDKQNLIR